MCGICGIYNFHRKPVDRDLIDRMNSTMIHRGPDGEGVYIDGNIGLGHRRLSIIDLDTGEQPMGNEDGSVQVVFNGEIYNFLELRNLLEAKGHRFRTRSDTESIILGYEEWGDSVVEHLRGMFAFALWDVPRRRLLLARDRIGKKPLYYYLDKGRILFASELKALLEDPTLPREIDPSALDCYLSFGYVPSPLAILKGIKKLPPAHYAIHDGNTLSLHQYWHLDMEHTTSEESEEEILAKLQSIFDEAVCLRLISDVPLGAFLSGGVDSSAVVAFMARLKGNEPVKTASIGFSEKKFDELEYARIVADLYSTDHTEFVVSPNALEIMDSIVWHLDEPFADSSAIPTYYVSKMTRQRVKVALSGDGGDETFAGYVKRYFMNRAEENIRKKIPRVLREGILGPIAKVYPRIDTLTRPLRLKNFLSNISPSLEQAYFRDMSFYFLPEMKKKLYRSQLAFSLKDFSSSEILDRHFRSNHNPDVTTRVQYVDIMTYLPEDILVKVDRMSMAHSLEVRSPILDHKLMEFVGTLPSSLKLNGRESKYIFKKMNEHRLPRHILHRGKQGFSVPLADWLRGDLKGFADDTLFSTSSNLSDYFNMAYVKDLWNRHQGGRQDYSAPLWALMMFGLWHQRFM
jgi:asparagine synthase (glutamine-hydrolysing)